MAREATTWTVETGGDLFGLWEGIPTIYLATRVGPGAVRDHAHFRLDVEYLRQLSASLSADWGLRYFGDWHSHHRLGLSEPSRGDRQRIRRVAARNSFSRMAEIIVTFLDSGKEASSAVRLHPWIYDDGVPDPAVGELVVLPGASPVRQALAARGGLPDQELDRWHEVPQSRLDIAIAVGTAESVPSVVEPISRQLVHHARRVLERESGRPVEEHAAPFGTVLAAPVDDTRFLGFAISPSWPCEVLAVYWIDRGTRSSEPLDIPRPADLLTPEELAVVYRVARRRKEDDRESH